MTLIGYFVAGIAAFLLSLLGAALISRIGHRLGLTDTPNERSSHSLPKPRGGGIGIVVAVTTVLFACGASFRTDVNGAALVAGALLVTLVGLIDDVKSVLARYRFVAHLLASVLVVITLPSGWTILLFGHWELFGCGGVLVGILGIVWMVNLFNFMDGIDGIAGAEAVFVASAGASLVFSTHPGHPFGLAFALVAAASAGFLAINWPPSRVFLGDVGSGFLGFSIGALAFCTSAAHFVSIWTWLILIAVFLVDATLTLLRRVLRGERWYAAHRMHAYQRLSRRWSSHRRVTFLVIGVNMFWLLPCAVASQKWAAWGLIVFLVAVAPILVVAWWAGAGLPD